MQKYLHVLRVYMQMYVHVSRVIQGMDVPAVGIHCWGPPFRGRAGKVQNLMRPGFGSGVLDEGRGIVAVSATACQSAYMKGQDKAFLEYTVGVGDMARCKRRSNCRQQDQYQVDESLGQ